jgi:Arm DNA-binding domain
VLVVRMRPVVVVLVRIVHAVMVAVLVTVGHARSDSMSASAPKRNGQPVWGGPSCGNVRLEIAHLSGCPCAPYAFADPARSGATFYRVRYRTPDRGQTQRRGFKTKRDAEIFAASVEVAKMRREYVAPSAGKVTVGSLGPAWLQRQRGHMKPSGFRSYESAWRVHVESGWGRTRVSEIRFTAVQAWVSQLATKRVPLSCRRPTPCWHGYSMTRCRTGCWHRTRRAV